MKGWIKMQNRNQLFDFAISQYATDIHICAGSPVQLRIGRKLKPVTEEKLTPEKSRDLCYELLTPEQVRIFEEQLDYDLMLAYGRSRFRVNVGYFNGAVGATVRDSVGGTEIARGIVFARDGDSCAFDAARDFH
jgi:Tfp pilus assembly pilus retraction ATPase PilT